MSVRAVVVGDPADASALDARLRALFAELDVPYATVAVWAVPDSAAMTALSARVDELPALFAPPPPPVVPPPPSLEARVRAAWPSQNVAAPVAVWAADGPPPRVRVVHLGPELGATGRELLGRAVALDGVTPVIDDLALVPVELTDDGISDWLARALALLGRASEFPEVHFCVGLPPRPARGRRDPIPALVRDSITAGVGSQPNAFITSSDVPRLVPTLDACEPPAPTPPPP